VIAAGRYHNGAAAIWFRRRAAAESAGHFLCNVNFLCNLNLPWSGPRSVKLFTNAATAAVTRILSMEGFVMGVVAVDVRARTRDFDRHRDGVFRLSARAGVFARIADLSHRTRMVRQGCLGV
jgi:hypothetical protein